MESSKENLATYRLTLVGLKGLLNYMCHDLSRTRHAEPWSDTRPRLGEPPTATDGRVSWSAGVPTGVSEAGCGFRNLWANICKLTLRFLLLFQLQTRFTRLSVLIMQ